MPAESPHPGLPFQYQLNEARTEVVIQTPEPQAKLQTQELDNVIRLLGLIRATMKPPVPPEKLPTDNLPLTPATNWKVFPFDLGKECLLVLRTDTFGWLSLVLDPVSRGQLVDALTGADRQPAQGTKH